MRQCSVIKANEAFTEVIRIYCYNNSPKTNREFPPRLLNLVSNNLSNPSNAIAYIRIHKKKFGFDKRTFLVLCSFIHVFIYVFFCHQGWSTASDFECTPNETFQQDCNKCICSSDGKTAACTLMLCIAHDKDIPEVSTSDVQLLPASTEASLPQNQTAVTEGTSEHIENNNHVCNPNDVKMQVGS